MGFIQIPWEQRLVAIDGETQLAARYEAANIDPETARISSRFISAMGVTATGHVNAFTT